MTLIVEDGTGILGAESYVSAASAVAYWSARGYAVALTADASVESALRRATMFLDATYRGRYPGYRTFGRVQGLEWPRVGAFTLTPDNGRSDAWLTFGPESYTNSEYTQGYDYIPANQVPREIIAATCEAALREVTELGSLAPDLERGGAITMLKAGSVEVQYGSAASATTSFQTIDLVLASLLLPSSPFGGRAVRG